MKRLIVLIASFALVLAACGGGSSTKAAATVNGTDITIDDVDALFYEVTEEFTPEQLATYLGTLIQWTASEQAAEEDFDFVATPDAIDERIDAFLIDYGYTGEREAFLEEQNVSEDGLERLATQLLIEDAAAGALSDTVEEPTLEDAQAEIDANPMEYTQVCASHILVATEDEAKDLEKRLADGEDFAELAKELSTDTGSGANGGSLGCASPARYVPEFAQATIDAEIGVVTDPVETQFGFHLIRVDERTEATPEEVQSVMKDQAATDAIDAWLIDAIKTADVTVDEQYGTWETEPTPRLVPPTTP